MAATELRVHLGEALRALAREDIVIEKGGVPVALLTRFEPGSPARMPAALEAEYERSLAKRAEPGGFERMERAMEAGWEGLNIDEMEANIYRWRREGTRPAAFRVDDDDDTEADADGGEVSVRYERVHSRDVPQTHVAEGDGPRHGARGSGD